MSEPFLGYTNDVSKAFPGIKDFRVTIAEDPNGYYLTSDRQRERTYRKGDPTRHPCANPRCQQGGLDIQQLVMVLGPGTYNFDCEGHDGSPKGRRKGDPCDNRFSVKVDVERRPALR